MLSNIFGLRLGRGYWVFRRNRDGRLLILDSSCLNDGMNGKTFCEPPRPRRAPAPDAAASRCAHAAKGPRASCGPTVFMECLHHPRFQTGWGLRQARVLDELHRQIAFPSCCARGRARFRRRGSSRGQAGGDAGFFWMESVVRPPSPRPSPARIRRRPPKRDYGGQGGRIVVSLKRRPRRQTVRALIP